MLNQMMNRSIDPKYNLHILSINNRNLYLLFYYRTFLYKLLNIVLLLTNKLNQ